jgi:hypothetical protein
MRHENAAHLGQAKGVGLLLRRFGENIGCQENRRSGAAFKPYRVVHTARRARPSIGQRFDDEVVVGGDAAPELFGRRLGEGRLAITVDFDVGQSPGE